MAGNDDIIQPVGYQPDVSEGAPAPAGTQEFISGQNYGSEGQQIGTALEGAAQAATFGVSTLAERLLGIRGKDILARQEENPISHTTGQIGGLVASSLVAPGGGAAGGLEAAGARAAEALGATGIAKAAIKGTVENALLESGDQASRYLAGDKNQTAENALASVGLAGAAGGLISGGVSAIHPMWDATVGKRVSGILGAVKDRLSGAGVVPEGVRPAIAEFEAATGKAIDPAVQGAMSKDPFVRQIGLTLQESAQQSGIEFQNSIKQAKSDLKEYLLKSYGMTTDDAENLTNTFSKYHMGTEARDALTKELQEKAAPGIVAEEAKQQYANEAPVKAAAAIERTPEQVQDLPNLSNIQRGRAMQESQIKELKTKLDPTIQKFQNIQKDFAGAKLSDADKQGLKDQIDTLIQKNSWQEAPSSPEFQLANRIKSEVDNYSTMDSLKNAQSRLNGLWGAPEGRAASMVKNVFRESEGNLLQKAFVENVPEQTMMELHRLGEDPAAYVASARAEYGKAMNVIDSLNERLHVGKYHGPDSFYKALGEMKGETVLNRLTNGDDAELLNVLKEHTPQTAEMVRQAHLDDLAQKSAKEGLIDPVKLHKNVQDMTPELRDFALSEGQQGTIKGLKEGLGETANISVEDSMKTLNRVGKVIGIGQSETPSEFFSKLSDQKLTNENVINRLSKAAQGDVGFLNDLKQYAPDTLATIQQYEQKNLIFNAMKAHGEPGERLDMKKLITSLDAASPEWKKTMLTPEMMNRANVSNKILSAIKDSENVSKTAKYVDALLGDMPSALAGVISGLASGNPAVGFAVGTMTKAISRNIPDAVRLSLLKFIGSGGEVSAPAFMRMAHFIGDSMAGDTLASKSVKALVHAAGDVLPTKLIPEQRASDKLDKVIKQMRVSPEPMIEHKDNMAQYMPEHASAHSQSMARAISYLSSIKPTTIQGAPLDAKIPQDEDKEREYQTALQIANQPLIVLKKVNDGELRQEDLQHLTAMYPAYYQSLKQKMLNEISESQMKETVLPYKKQMMISMFMGAPMVSSLQPQQIQTAQASLSAVQAQQQQKQQNMQEQALKGGGKSLNNIVSQSQTPQQARQASKVGMA